MKKFTIVKTIPSTITEIYEVVANSSAEAIALVNDGEGFETSWVQNHNDDQELRVENESDGFMR